MVKFLNTTSLPFFDPTFFHGGGFNKYLQTKHKKWIFSATIHLTRKEFIFPGRYLKADHLEKKIGHGWWAIQKCQRTEGV